MKIGIFILITFTLVLGYAGVNNIKTQQHLNPPMIDLINEERADADLPALAYHELLSKSAKAKACDLKDRHYFSHADPDGIMSWHYMVENGIEYRFAGENLHEGSTDTRTKMEAWMSSPTHAKNILDERFDSVGYATCGDYTVQHFADLK